MKKTLCDYYREMNGKMDFCKTVARRLGVSSNTVINWCRGWSRPKEQSILEALSEITGISKDDLF